MLVSFDLEEVWVENLVYDVCVVVNVFVEVMKILLKIFVDVGGSFEEVFVWICVVYVLWESVVREYCGVRVV